MTARVPRPRPWAFATAIEVAPFAPSAARSTEELTCGQSGPIHTTAPLKPLLFSSVCLGPAPRRTIPLLISSVRVVANVPAESTTTFPSGQAVSAAWIAAVASCAPLPYAAASMVAHAALRRGIPPGIPGFHVVRLSAGMTYGVAAGDGTPTASEPVAPRPQASLSLQESAATNTAQTRALRVPIATAYPGGRGLAMRRRDAGHAAACEWTIA